MTTEELKQYNGTDDAKPVYVAVKGECIRRGSTDQQVSFLTCHLAGRCMVSGFVLTF